MRELLRCNPCSAYALQQSVCQYLVACPVSNNVLSDSLSQPAWSGCSSQAQMTLAVEDVPAKNVQAVEMQNAAARKVESSQQDFGKDVAGMVR